MRIPTKYMSFKQHSMISSCKGAYAAAREYREMKWYAVPHGCEWNDV